MTVVNGRRRPVLLFILALSTACGGDGGTAATDRVLDVAVTPADLTLRPGQTAPLAASVRTSGSSASTSVQWRSDAAAIATVSSQGVVTAVAAGTARITAVAQGDTTRRATATVTVRAAVTSVTISPRPLDSLWVYDTRSYTANVVADRPLATTAALTSSAPAIASISADGIVTARAPGSAFIVARSTADTTVRDSTRVIVPEPCTRRRLAVGAAGSAITRTNATAGPLACNATTARFSYELTQPSQWVELSFTSDSSVRVDPAQFSTRGSWGSEARTSSYLLAMARGTYDAQIGLPAGRTTSVIPFAVGMRLTAPACPPSPRTAVIGTFNVSGEVTLNTNCLRFTPAGVPDGTYYGLDFLLPTLRTGESITVSAATPAFVPLIEVYAESTAPVATTLTSTGGTQAVTFTATTDRILRVRVLSRTSNATGPVAITITGPTTGQSQTLVSPP